MRSGAKCRRFIFLRTTILLSLVWVLTPVSPVYAGGPHTPVTTSPANGSTAQSNPPTLCANIGQGDPDGDTVQIKFEAHDGGSIQHISQWLNVDASGNVCWTDTSPWSAGTTAWAVRSLAGGEQSGASGEWTVIIPQPSQPQESCQVDALSANAAAPQAIGTPVVFSFSASCTTGVRDISVFKDGGYVASVSGSSGSWTWNTSGESPGNHVISVEAHGNGGGTASRSHPYDLTQGAPPPPPQVTCSISNVNVSPPTPQMPGVSVGISASANCNTGLRAMRLLINGGVIYEIGGVLNYTWNTSGLGQGNYSITIQAAGQGDNNWSQAASYSLSYTLGTSSQAPTMPTFYNGDLVRGSEGRVYIILDGTRRWIPNPDTFYALGFAWDQINNKGANESQIESLPRGPDVPDVNRDPSGFAAFRQQYAAYLPGGGSSGGGAGSGSNVCPAQPSRLRPGGQAVVSPEQAEYVHMRELPDLDAAIIRDIQAYSIVSIVSGPQCADGFRWFQVGYEGRVGWVAEVGQTGIYNLIPNGEPLPGSGESSTESGQTGVSGDTSQPQQPEASTTPSNEQGSNSSSDLGSGNDGLPDQQTGEQTENATGENTDSNSGGETEQNLFNFSWYFEPLTIEEYERGLNVLYLTSVALRAASSSCGGPPIFMGPCVGMTVLVEGLDQIVQIGYDAFVELGLFGH